MKNFKKILLITIGLILLPLNAANTDDEIIKNLDFFQNMEIVKNDNPFISKTATKKLDEKSVTEDHLKTEKGSMNVEMKK